MSGKSVIDLAIRSLQSSLVTAAAFAAYTGLAAWSMLTVCVGIVFIFLGVDLLIGWLRERSISPLAWLGWGSGAIVAKSALPLVYILHTYYAPHVSDLGKRIWVISHHWPLLIGFTVLATAATVYVVLTTRSEARGDAGFPVEQGGARD